MLVSVITQIKNRIDLVPNGLKSIGTESANLKALLMLLTSPDGLVEMLVAAAF